MVVKARASIAPHVTIGASADIGGETAIDVGATIGAGAKIEGTIINETSAPSSRQTR